MKAIELGLEPLAKVIFMQKSDDVDRLADQFLSNDVPTKEAALQGARDIIAEWLSVDENVRNKVRFAFKKGAFINCKVARNKEEEGAKYRDYFAYSEKLSRCPSHRILAMLRGESENFLRVSIEPDEEEVMYRLERDVLADRNEASEQVKKALHDGYKRLISPSIETEFRNLGKEKADEEAIVVFVKNLRQLLLAPPVDEYGATAKILDLVKKYKIESIAIGNGTAGRETMALCQKIQFPHSVNVFMVNESGASIYSASAIAREEFPKEDITVRGAVSIGRRLMDPLAELVKIDPKSIGVGQYQHDVNQVKLKESLGRTVESCVNSVGINLNTASKHLLTYVSGLGPTLAKNIVNFRAENGTFSSRKELKKVPRMGEKAFEQCAGFLRIRSAKNPLDNTAVHPESYHIVEKMAKDAGASVQQLIENESTRKQLNLKQYVTETVGLPTLNDILKELSKPGLDPRGEAKSFEFAAGIKTVEDLQIGMVVPGIVTNVTNFGAFVDIGVKQDGLVHISQLANRFVKNPADVVSVAQEVKVKITDVDLKRGRVQLSMKEV